MVYEVDDFLISEPLDNKYDLSAKTIYLLDKSLRLPNEEQGIIKWEAEPRQYAGFELARSDDRGCITLRMSQKIREAVRAHIPALIDGDQQTVQRLGLLKGVKLQNALDNLRLAPKEDFDLIHKGGCKLNAEQKLFQGATGSGRYIISVQPRAELALKCLSTVAARPPPGSYLVAQSVLADMFAHIDDGITYGGASCIDVWRPEHSAPGLHKLVDGLDGGHTGESGIVLHAGAPMQLEGHADASWSRVNAVADDDDIATILREAPADVISMLITRGGAAVCTKSKRLQLIVSASMYAEREATVKATEVVEFCRTVDIALGNLDTADQPTLVSTDNSGNQLVIGGEASSARSKHKLIKYVIVQQRVASVHIKVRHVSDAENPADFLTKWIGKEKFEASVEYATNAKNAVRATSPELSQSSKFEMQFAMMRHTTGK